MITEKDIALAPTGKYLFYYSNISQNGKQQGWFAGMNHFRARYHKEMKPNDVIVRCAHVGIAAPKGYHKPNGELANDPTERVPTIRGLIHAMTGR